MRAIFVALAGIILAGGAASACDDHHGTCKIEAWRYTHTEFMRALQIEGSATCDKGLAQIRLYANDGGKEKFLGVATGVIEGHALQAAALGIHKKPKALSIKYSISAE